MKCTNIRSWTSMPILETKYVVLNCLILIYIWHVCEIPLDASRWNKSTVTKYDFQSCWRCTKRNILKILPLLKPHYVQKVIHYWIKMLGPNYQPIHPQGRILKRVFKNYVVPGLVPYFVGNWFTCVMCMNSVCSLYRLIINEKSILINSKIVGSNIVRSNYALRRVNGIQDNMNLFTLCL
jgi:hypothetical protein